ncbi:MAG: PKD domain-containing protein, partial [Bacteroidales bacterium]|nr:PKD domain-containing protein [Bacteroidales bacterium]
GNPVNGNTYSTSIPGGGTILYSGSNASFNHASLVPNTTYYYKIWSYDGAMAYSTGSTSNATTTYSSANFNTDIAVSCTGSLTVNFTDASLGAYNSWVWDIDNNGTTDYTTQNPTHTYTSPGLYTVKLVVNNGDSEIIKENLILVMNSEPTMNIGCALTSNSNNGNAYGIGLSRFALGAIDFTTSSNDGYYKNYSCSKWTLLEFNKTYSVTIRTGTANNEGAKVYIDYNDNGTFESGEAVVSFPANKEGTRTLSFTTPSSGVELNKGIRLRVLSKFGSVPSSACDISSYGQAEDYTVYFVNDATWVGTVSSDWNTAGNWSYNVVPGAGLNAIIPSGTTNYPILTADVTCKNLSIRSGASVKINPAIALTVNGSLINAAGTSGLVIKSDITGTGSLIHTSENVNATVERYMNNTDWTNWVDGWHFLSSPVLNQPISPNFTTSPYDFYSWYEPQNLWVNHKNTTVSPTWNEVNGGGDFNLGSGYMAAYDEAGVKLFEGILNVEDVTKGNLTITGSTQVNRSWHLLGNPFSSALNWDGGSEWSLVNISGVAKIWNEENQSYSDLSSVPSSVIPSTNGVMVQVVSGTGSLVLPASKRIHSDQPFYKSSAPHIKLLVKNLESGSAQESHVYFNADASNGFDLKYDGEFLEGYGPKFYSSAEGLYLSTNTLPYPIQGTSIPFSLIPNEGASYKLSFQGLESISEALYLIDLKLNSAVHLNKNPEYSFTSEADDDAQRFVLSFSAVGFDETQADGKMNAWIIRNTLYVKSDDVHTKVGIFDMQGKQLLEKSLEELGYTVFL